MESKRQPTARAVVVVLPHSAGLSCCFCDGRKVKDVLGLKPERRKIERATVVRMMERVLTIVMLWQPAGIAFSSDFLYSGRA